MIAQAAKFSAFPCQQRILISLRDARLPSGFNSQRYRPKLPAFHHTVCLSFPPTRKKFTAITQNPPFSANGVPWVRKWQCPQTTKLHPAKAHSWEGHSWPPIIANNHPFPSYSSPGEIRPSLFVWFSKLTVGACLLRSGIAGLMYQFKLIPQNWESFYKPLMFGFHNFTTVRLIFKLSEAGLLK